MYRTRNSMVLLLALLAMPVGDAAEPRSQRAEAGARSEAAVDAEFTPTERMNRRFPQKVRVGDLSGLPLQDEDDRVLGRVERVVRTPANRIVLVTTWDRGWFGRGGRPVAIPLETVAILGRHINVLDLSRKEVAALPTWTGRDASDVPPDETIRIAISRR